MTRTAITGKQGWLLHFHDNRITEAITRLAKRLDVLELARGVGHREPGGRR